MVDLQVSCGEELAMEKGTAGGIRAARSSATAEGVREWSRCRSEREWSLDGEFE